MLSVGLFLLYGEFVKLETIDPLLGVASIAVFIGVVLMAVLLLKSGKVV